MPETSDSLLGALSLEQVLQTIPSGLFLVDRHQRVVHWNAEAERITGYSAAEALGQHCSFLSGIPCGDVCGLYDLSFPKPIIGATCTVRRKDGKRITLLKNVDLLKDTRGAIVGGVESFIDISRQAALEVELRHQAASLEKTVLDRTAELERERTQLRNLLDAMADFAYICSADHRVVVMNRAMIDSFGDHRGEICFQAFYGLSSPCVNCPMESVLAGDMVRQERRLPRNGRTYEVIHSLLRAPDDSPQKLAVFRDITERKEAEEKLREANHELDAFVYTVSHDLRTPLTPIMAYAEFLEEEYRDSLDSQAIDALREIEKHAQKMLALMEDLLVLARVGHVEPPQEPVDPGPVLSEVLAELRGTIEKEGVVLRVDPLPKVPVPPTFLFQIYINLIGNALRYAGRPGAPIEIGGEAEGGIVRLYVRDHGPGIPDEERERIFDPFFRGSTAAGVMGTGIGLSIVRKVVRLSGGRVWIETTPGGGCTFFMEFSQRQGKTT